MSEPSQRFLQQQQQQQLAHVAMHFLPLSVQREWRRVLADRNAAATSIQACWRGHVVRKQNGWMRRLLNRCTLAYSTLAQDRCGPPALPNTHTQCETACPAAVCYDCSQAASHIDGGAVCCLLVTGWTGATQRP